MLHVILESAALGIAGFDPVGLFVLLGAMTLGAKRAGVIALMIATIGLTFLFGFIPVVTVGHAITSLLDSFHRIHHHTWGVLAIALGIGLVLAGAWRWVRHRNGQNSESSERAPRSITPAGLATAGALVALSTFLDPAFYGIILYAADQPKHSTGAASIFTWTLFSHSGLVVVGLAALTGFYAPVEQFLATLRQRWGKYTAPAITTAMVIGGLISLIEGIAKWHHDWIFFS